jgi:DNA-directed RNA polymerase specialized sigma24 family protein
MEFLWAETIVPERPKKADPRIEGLMDALGELSEAKQTLLRKHYFEGKSVAVIAKEMGLSKSATGARLQTLKGTLLQGFKSSFL